MPVLRAPKEELFAQAVAKGEDEGQAYHAAGFEYGTALQRNSRARRLLAKMEVAARVAEIQEAGARRAEITVERVLLELAKIGFADIRKVARWSNGLLPARDEQDAIMGTVVVAIPSDMIGDDIAAAISEVSQGVNGIRIKMHDKQAALLNIGRHLAMFKDTVQLDGPVQVIRQRYEQLVPPPKKEEPEKEAPALDAPQTLQ